MFQQLGQDWFNSYFLKNNADAGENNPFAAATTASNSGTWSAPIPTDRFEASENSMMKLAEQAYNGNASLNSISQLMVNM